MKNNCGLVPVLLLCLFCLFACKKPKEPEYIRFENLRFEKVGISESIIGAEIKYFNPNNYSLQLKDGSVDVYLNNKFLGHSNLDTLLNIPGRDTFSVPVSMKVELKNLFKNALQLILNPVVEVKVEGNAKVGRGGVFVKIPINYTTKQNVDSLLRDSAFIELIK